MSTSWEEFKTLRDKVTVYLIGTEDKVLPFSYEDIYTRINYTTIGIDCFDDIYVSDGYQKTYLQKLIGITQKEILEQFIESI